MRATFLVTTTIVLMTAATLCAAEAEYLGGTAKSIPSKATGRLDLSDPNDLLFVYGKGVYRLPFEQIRSFEWDHAKTARRVLGHVTIPHAPWTKQEDVLNLSFRSEAERTGVVSFKVTGKDLSTLEWALKSRIQDPKEAAVNVDRAKLPESWWGDRYWRTTRNSPAWPSAETAGTK